MARALSERFALPYTELDALFHGPGWVERPTFAADVAAVVAGESWIIDSDGYSAVRDLMWARADTLVWMDLPRWQVMSRVVRRSLWRGLRRAELWNGNRETFGAWRDSGHPVWWAWHQHGNRRRTIGGRLEDPVWVHLHVVRLRTAAEARSFLAKTASKG